MVVGKFCCDVGGGERLEAINSENEDNNKCSVKWSWVKLRLALLDGEKRAS